MTLGERICQLRREQRLSQEALADRMGVSRQAVSKWEKNLSYPDTENLIALAALFGVSADELAGLRRASGQGAAEQEAPEAAETTEQETPDRGTMDKASSRRRRWPYVLAAAAILVVALTALAVRIVPYFLWRDISEGPSLSTADGTGNNAETAASSRPGVEETGEFALLWRGENGYEYLSVGEQAETFPFGTTLSPTALGATEDTDLAGMTLHRVPCGALSLTYTHLSGGPAREVLQAVETITAGYETPRGIQVGSDETEVLAAYEGELVYLMEESGENVLCRNDYRYAYAPAEAYGMAIEFYLDGGHVAGIAVRSADDRGSEAYAVDNMTIFPIVDGQPDFSGRQEPEQETADAAQTVYIALQALLHDGNLSAEDAYRCRQDIYGNLYQLDWQAYGALGEAGKEDETVFELLGYLNTQETLSEGEITGLLSGAVDSSLDGAYTDSYALAMARAFVAYPESYVKCIASERFADADDRQILISLTGYGCDVPEDFHKEAAEAVTYLFRRSGALDTETEKACGEALYERIVENPL